MAFTIRKLWTMIYPSMMIFNIQASLGRPDVPCYFIFGDSLFDSGNNNNLRTALKANFLPYGIDFPGGIATGRFTDGRTMADIIAEKLSFEDYIPPFATAKGQEIMNGVNYASGGAGIRNESGSHLGDRICINRQLTNHQTTISRLISLLGNQTAVDSLLSKCLYIVGAGNNDYMNNYFQPKYYKTSKLYTPEKYAKILQQQYSRQLTKLYNFGARKIAVFGLSPTGCTPAMREMYAKALQVCADSVNYAVNLFHEKLWTVVDDLNAKLNGVNFTVINIFNIQFGDILSNGTDTISPDQPCCKVSAIYKGQCIPEQNPCVFRNSHFFFDNFHPTETVNIFTASRAYRALLPSDAYPVDIYKLVRL